MDDKKYERKLRILLCLIFLAAFLVYGFTNPRYDNTYLLYLSLFQIAGMIHRSLFRTAELAKVGIGLSLMWDEMFDEWWMIILIVMALPMLIYNTLIIRYNRKRKVWTDEEINERQYKVSLSRKLGILLVIQQLSAVIMLYTVDDNMYWRIHFRMMNYKEIIAGVSYVVIITTLAILIEWKHIELFEFIENGKFLLFFISSPYFLILGTFALARGLQLHHLFLLALWLSMFFVYLIYLVKMKKYHKKVRDEYIEKKKRNSENRIRGQRSDWTECTTYNITYFIPKVYKTMLFEQYASYLGICLPLI